MCLACVSVCMTRTQIPINDDPDVMILTKDKKIDSGVHAYYDDKIWISTPTSHNYYLEKSDHMVVI